MLRVYCSCPGQSATMKLRFGGREIAIGDVDRDALLALGGEAVDQQARSRSASPRVPTACAVLGQRRHLVVEHLSAVVEQAARSASTCRHRRCRR